MKESGTLRESHCEAQDGETGCSQMIIFTSTLLSPKCFGVIGRKRERVLQGRERTGVLPFHGG